MSEAAYLGETQQPTTGPLAAVADDSFPSEETQPFDIPMLVPSEDEANSENRPDDAAVLKKKIAAFGELVLQIGNAALPPLDDEGMQMLRRTAYDTVIAWSRVRPRNPDAEEAPVCTCQRDRKRKRTNGEIIAAALVNEVRGTLPATSSAGTVTVSPDGHVDDSSSTMREYSMHDGSVFVVRVDEDGTDVIVLDD